MVGCWKARGEGGPARRGEAGSLLSGGVIPLLNIVIGLKVASGLGSIIFDMLSTGSE